MSRLNLPHQARLKSRGTVTALDNN
jgi:hypothetical protein